MATVALFGLTCVVALNHGLSPAYSDNVTIINARFITRESSYCFQRVLAVAILSVPLSLCRSVRTSLCHRGVSVKNGAS